MSSTTTKGMSAFSSQEPPRAVITDEPSAYGDRRQCRRGCAAGRGSARCARLGVCNDSALVVQHLPLLGRVLPERRPAGDAFSLPKDARQQVHIKTDPAAVEIAGLPLIRVCALVPLIQDVQDVLAAEWEASDFYCRR